MKKYWDELLISLNVCDPISGAELFGNLMHRYNERHRYYHTTAHLEHLFRLLDENQIYVRDRASLIAAIFFHDAVYSADSKSNEEDSARLAVFHLASMGASWEFCARVADLIRMTAIHQAPKDDPDARLFLDMDMAVLGAEPKIYDAYAATVRREYEPIYGYDSYNRGRLNKFILPYLGRDRLFLTDIMRDKYETQARANMQWEKVSLEAKLAPKLAGPAP